MSNVDPNAESESSTDTDSDVESEQATEAETEQSARTGDEIDRSHLEDVEDGCGCAEVWEHLSEQRE